MKLLSSKSHGLEDVRMTIAYSHHCMENALRGCANGRGQRIRKTNKDLAEDLANGAGLIS